MVILKSNLFNDPFFISLSSQPAAQTQWLTVYFFRYLMNTLLKSFWNQKEVLKFFMESIVKPKGMGSKNVKTTKM